MASVTGRCAPGATPRNGLWPSALAVASVAAAALEDVDAAASVRSSCSTRPSHRPLGAPPGRVPGVHLVVHRVVGRRWPGQGRGPLRGRDPSQHASRREVLRGAYAARLRADAHQAGSRPGPTYVLDLLIVQRPPPPPGDGCACQRGGTPRGLEAGTAVGAGPPKRVSPGGRVLDRYEGSLVRLRDSKVFALPRDAAGQPGREFHVVDLEAEEDQVGRSPSARRGAAEADGVEVRPDLGDAGEMLDATAKAADRLEVSRQTWKKRRASTTRRAARQEEIDFIANELARGGWARRPGPPRSLPPSEPGST